MPAISPRFLTLLSAFLMVLAVGLVEPTPVFAQTDAKEAGKLYKEGIDLYFGGEYGVAITKFRAGYLLDPNAMFLYSLSLCFSKLGNFEEALANAQQAEGTGGMPAEATTKNRSRLAAFSILVSGEKMIAAQLETADAPLTCATNADCGDGEICNIRRGVCLAELPDSGPSKPLFSPVGWGGVGLGAVGVGMLVAGGLTSVGVKKNEDRYAIVSDASSSEFDAKERDDLTSKIDSQKSLGRVLILGGFGALAAGGALVAVDLFVLKKEEEPTTRLVPTIGPGLVGLSWSLKF